MTLSVVYHSISVTLLPYAIHLNKNYRLFALLCNNGPHTTLGHTPRQYMAAWKRNVTRSATQSGLHINSKISERDEFPICHCVTDSMERRLQIQTNYRCHPSVPPPLGSANSTVRPPCMLFTYVEFIVRIVLLCLQTTAINMKAVLDDSHWT